MKKIRETWIYRTLSSTKTAVYLLFALTVFYLIGTVFPQGVTVESYEKAGGTFLFAAKYLGVLHVFKTPLFLASAVLLGINTVICTVERLRGLLKSLRKDSTVPGKRIPLEPGTEPEKLVDALTAKGFRFRGAKGGKTEETVLFFSKGVNLSALSIAFHLLLALCIGAFFHTFLFSFENHFTLGQGEETEITLRNGEKAPFKVKLNEFKTVYVDDPEINFPNSPLLRIASILSGPSEETRFTLNEGAVSVTDWISDVSILENGEEIMRASVKVGKPLSYGGVRIYQMGYDQEVVMQVGKKKLTITPGKPFEVGGEKFVISAVKHGKWLRLDGGEGEVKPHVVVYKVTGKNRYDRKRMGRAFMGKWANIAKKRFKLLSFKEKSVFSYRKDPAVGFLYLAGFLVNALIFLRLVITEEKVRITLNRSTGGFATITLRGVFGRSQAADILDNFRKKA